MVVSFYHLRYTRCLSILQRVCSGLTLDMYLGCDEHFEKLYRLTGRKTIMQYVSSLVPADLGKMKHVFRTNRAKLENELLTLIESEQIDVRINTQHDALRTKREEANDSRTLLRRWKRAKRLLKMRRQCYWE